MVTGQRCAAAVKAHSSWDGEHEWRCSRAAKADGYCTQHHPDAVAEGAAKRLANREAAKSDLMESLLDHEGTGLPPKAVTSIFVYRYNSKRKTDG